MPRAPVIDADLYLAPIAGDAPAGKRLSSKDINELKEFQREFDPEAARAAAEAIDNDGLRKAELAKLAGEKRKLAEWDKILRFTGEFLKSTGKDLLAVMFLTEALARTDRLAGLRDGLKLARRMCEDCWDRMHPEIDDPQSPDDLDGRVSPFQFLVEKERYPQFPSTVRELTLFRFGDAETPVSHAVCHKLEKRPALIPDDELRAAVATAKPSQMDEVKLVAEDAAEAIAELTALGDHLIGRVGETTAPSFRPLKDAISDVEQFARKILEIRSGDAPPMPHDEPTAGGAGPSGGGLPRAASVGAGRDEIYARLIELVALLEKVEPHSPVPHLIRRAVEMKAMPFPALVDAITRDAGVLTFLRTPLPKPE